ncbi:MAG: DUF308 domain-containing protein [Candidatus Sulfotelmatobacter sp.]
MRDMAAFWFEGSRRNWKRVTQLGIVLILIGIAALSTVLNPSAAPVALIGWLLILAGIAEVVHAFRTLRSDGFLFHLISGLTGLPIGLLTVTHPGAGAVPWMLVMASFFTVIGLFQAMSAFWLRFPNWGWMVFEGIVTLVLGSVMWTAWIWLIPWFLGFAVGLSLMLRGWSLVMLAQGLRRRNLQRIGKDKLHAGQRDRAQTPGFAPN